MHLTHEKLLELVEVAKLAATKAGEYIASRRGDNIVTESKAGGENIASQVVTEVDHAAEEIILGVLKPTLEPYGLGLLTEESTDDGSRFEKPYFWCIDPLDGTLAFSRDEDGYSTAVALISSEGEPLIGAVYNSRTGSLYHAFKDGGAFKNGKPFKAHMESKSLTLLYDQSYLKHPEYAAQVEKLRKDVSKVGLENLTSYHLGGAVMNGIATIEMAPAVYFKFPKKADGGGSIWDFAASSIIQKEAGGFNADYFRRPLDLNRKDSTFMNHNGVIYASNDALLEIIPKV